MIDFERHITKLLLSNDCVIVPGFGGFMAHHVDAYYDSEECMFFPPRRTLGFNPQLTMNDSLLVQSFIEAYDISYPEALNQIENNVSELKLILESKGEYEISGLGTLTLTDDGKYDFAPCEAGIATPSLYALDSFEIKKVGTKARVVALHDAASESKATVEPTESVEDTENETTSDSSKTVPMWLLRDLAAVCIVIIAFFLVPAPVNKMSTTLSDSTVNTDLLLKIMPKDITTGKPNTVSIKASAAKQDSIKAMANAKEEDESISTSPYYTIVLASKITQKGAQTYVQNLHKRGFTDADVLKNASGVRVIYGQYSSQGEASNARKKITDNIEFADSWIMLVN